MHGPGTAHLQAEVRRRGPVQAASTCYMHMHHVHVHVHVRVHVQQVGKQALTMAVDRARSTRELVRRKGIHLTLALTLTLTPTPCP